MILGKDPEDAELGTQTYRCKGCTGEYCRICNFGDMWERDITQMPYSIKEILHDCDKYIAEADRRDERYVDCVNVNFLREIKRILTSDTMQDAIDANVVTEHSQPKYKVGNQIFRFKYAIDPKTGIGTTLIVQDTVQRVFVGKTVISYKIKHSDYRVREECLFGNLKDAKKAYATRKQGKNLI